MKSCWSAFLIIVVAVATQPAFAAPGDVWSLSGDMQITGNPSPPIDPGPAGGGTGTWTYFYNSPAGIPFEELTSNPAMDVNGEVPDAGIGWYRPDANHVMLVKFSVDFNPPPAFGGTGNDKTNFRVGDVGGHATMGASWTTDHAGTFLVEWLGYNARNQATANPNEQGRTTNLRLLGPTLNELDAQAIVGGGGFDGRANAYTNSMVMPLAAGETVYLTQEGGEWAGLDLRITEIVPEPASGGLLAIGFAAIGLQRRARCRKC